MECSFSSKKPNISKDCAINLAKNYFGIQSEILEVKEFDSYCDINFYFKTKSNYDRDNEFILKILNHVDSAIEGMVEAQNGAMIFLKNQGLVCPVPVESSGGDYIVYHDCSQSGKAQRGDSSDKEREGMNALRLLRFVPGEVMKHVAVLTEDLLFDLGQYIGKLDKMLKDYGHPGLNNQVSLPWDLVHLSNIKPYITTKYLGSEERKNLILNVYDQFFSTVPQVLQKCTKQVIHGDINEDNVIVTQNQHPNDAADAKWSIAGVIDFGDVCYSYRVFNIAISMAHIISFNYSRGNPRHLECVGKILKGYQSIYPLSAEELSIIYWCVAGRFIQLLTIGTYRSSFEPENMKYLMGKDILIWKVLPEYLKVNCKEMLDKWMNDKEA